MCVSSCAFINGLYFFEHSPVLCLIPARLLSASEAVGPRRWAGYSSPVSPGSLSGPIYFSRLPDGEEEKFKRFGGKECDPSPPSGRDPRFLDGLAHQPGV